MIQETIRALIESKLNDNTADKQFIVGSYAYLTDLEKHFIYNIRRNYTLIEKNFIPVMMSYSSTFQPIPGQINGSANMTLEFLIRAEDQTELDTDLATLDEFVEKIVGTYELLTGGYNSVWNMDGLVPLGLTEVPINGDYYLRISTNVYVDFSDTNQYGNQYEYYLNDQQIRPYDIKVERMNEEDLPHNLGNAEAKGGNKTSTWMATMTLYVDDYVSRLVDSFSNGDYDMDAVHKYTEDSPTRATPLDISVRINSAVYTPNLGEKVMATIVVYKADEDYVEPPIPPTPPTPVKSWVSSTLEYWIGQDELLRDTSTSEGTGQPIELASDYSLGFAMRKSVQELEEGILYSYWKVELR